MRYSNFFWIFICILLIIYLVMSESKANCLDDYNFCVQEININFEMILSDRTYLYSYISHQRNNRYKGAIISRPEDSLRISFFDKFDKIINTYTARQCEKICYNGFKHCKVKHKYAKYR